MPIDKADLTRLKSDTATDMGERVLRWFAQIGAAVIKLDQAIFFCEQAILHQMRSVLRAPWRKQELSSLRSRMSLRI